MKSLLEGSIIYRSCRRFFDLFSMAYSQSTLYKVGSIIKLWYSNSVFKTIVTKLSNAVTNYANRQSNAKLSRVYKFLSSIGRLLDALAGKVHIFFSRQAETSASINTIKSVITESKNNLSSVAAALILPFMAGYSLITTIKGNWTTTKLIYIIFLGILVIACLASLDKWKSWIKSSAVYKVCHHIWE